MTIEELEAIENHMSNIPSVGAMYAPVMLAWLKMLVRQRDEARERLESTLVALAKECDDGPTNAEELLTAVRKMAQALRRVKEVAGPQYSGFYWNDGDRFGLVRDALKDVR
jgi:hypothetical protein